MKARWYQHKLQGGKSMISLKNKLPNAETLASIQQAKRMYQFLLSSRFE
jgi:hypothetical protein